MNHSGMNSANEGRLYIITPLLIAGAHIQNGHWVNHILRSVMWFLTHLFYIWHYLHYDDVTMNLMASQITSLTIVYSTVYSGGDQRKHQSSASLAFVRGFHRRPVKSPRKGPVTRKMFPFDDVIMFPPEDESFNNRDTDWLPTSWSLQGLYSLSSKASYHKISWSLDATRFGFRLFKSLWHLTGTSTAALSSCLSNVRAMR